MQGEDDDEFELQPFEQGHWEWGEEARQLVFIRDLKLIRSVVEEVGLKSIRKMEFKCEVDLLEEQSFKKHFQRHPIENDVVRLQDVKDVVLFIAPKCILTKDVINILHLRPMERFLRALIFYCQYYLQVATEMAERVLALQSKIKTKASKDIELLYEKNLRDVRLLLAKEYCGFLQGTDEYAKFHHNKVGTTMSLSNKDTLIFETFLRVSTHIAWVALGRKSFPELELEIQRIFKSNTFNVVKHQLKTDFEKDMSEVEHTVVYGGCERREKTLTIHSPLLNEVTCTKSTINYRLFGIGDFEYPDLNSRLLYFKHILSTPETELEVLGISIGIIGLPREGFDTMLREIKKQTASVSSDVIRKSASRMSSGRSSVAKSTKSVFTNLPLYPDIVLPGKHLGQGEVVADCFPGTPIPFKFQKNEQRLKWLHHVTSTKKRGVRGNKSK